MPLNLPTQKIAHIALRLIISAQYAVFFFFAENILIKKTLLLGSVCFGVQFT